MSEEKRNIFKPFFPDFVLLFLVFWKGSLIVEMYT